jgi:hypothetical protein
MGLIELRADCKLQRERIMASNLPEGLKTELADNVWPFLEALLEENLGMDEAIGDLIEQSDNVLQPELAAAIVGALELGKLICKEADALIGQTEDDLRKKRITDLLKQYRQAAEIVIDEVAAATVDLEPDEDPTPVEIPTTDDPEEDPDADPEDADAEAEADHADDDDDAETDPVVEEDDADSDADEAAGA